MLNDPTLKTPRTKKPTLETPDAQGNRNTWEQNKNGNATIWHQVKQTLLTAGWHRQLCGQSTFSLFIIILIIIISTDVNMILLFFHRTSVTHNVNYDWLPGRAIDWQGSQQCRLEEPDKTCEMYIVDPPGVKLCHWYSEEGWCNIEGVPMCQRVVIS